MVPFVFAIGAAGLTPGALEGGNPPQMGVGMVLLTIGFVLAIYGAMALIGVGYFAAYLRKVIGNLELGQLGFHFTAKSKDWLKLFLGHIGLVVVTLGVGLIFLSYRNWSFFIRHLEAVGEVDLVSLTQSPTEQSTDAEGLASAFDIGAI